MRFEDFWDRPLEELFQQLQATPAGLTTEEAGRRLRFYGPNSLVRESRFAALFSFFAFFANPSSSFLSLPAAYLLHSESTSAG
jgi:magnesium-transporting ATPase (P-type)